MLLPFIPINKPVLRSLQGLVLATGSPVGWMLIQFFNGVNPLQDLLHHPGVYLYMLVGTAIFFALFGYYSGAREAEFESRSERDGLTGLYNTRYFWKRLHEDLSAAQRLAFPLSVISVDLDHFKRINDTYGHAAGDRVLMTVARTMEDNKRGSDVIARVGGEEFGVILPFADHDAAMEVASRMHSAIGALRIETKSHPPISITASMGIASYPLRPERRAEALFEKADRAMYAAKQSGRNRIMYDMPHQP